MVPAGYGDGKILEIIKELDSRVDSEMVLSLEPHLGSFEGLAGLEKASNLSNMEQSGPGKFELAVTALRAILKEVN